MRLEKKVAVADLLGKICCFCIQSCRVGDTKVWKACKELINQRGAPTRRTLKFPLMGLAGRLLSLLPGPPFTVVLSRAESGDESAPVLNTWNTPRGPTPPAPLLVTFTFLPQVFMQSILALLSRKKSLIICWCQPHAKFWLCYNWQFDRLPTNVTLRLITVCLKVEPFNQMVGSWFGPLWGQILAAVVQQVVQHWMIIKSDMSIVICCNAGK